MKTCSYCKEAVRDDAIKCRYCQSSLLPTMASPTELKDDRHVTYIVDTDIVRFAKFSAAVLAVFLVVGATLFGFKLEASVERVSSLLKAVETASSELKTSQTELQNAKLAVVALKTDVETVLSHAKRLLGEIETQRDSAVEIHNSMKKTLSASQEEVLAQIKSTEPSKARGTSKLWPVGASIRIRFIGGTSEQQDLVKRTADEWTKYANLTFQFVSSGNTDVRIAFDSASGSWSYVGTDALAISQKEPTMNFGWLKRENILHEFGHLLGLIEEHQNPNADIKWNVPAIKSALQGPPNHFSDQQIQKNVLNKVPRKEVGEYRAFDPKSIMAYSFPPEQTGGVSIGGATNLSESDKRLVQRLYPKK